MDLQISEVVADLRDLLEDSLRIPVQYLVLKLVQSVVIALQHLPVIADDLFQEVVQEPLETRIDQPLGICDFPYDRVAEPFVVYEDNALLIERKCEHMIIARHILPRRYIEASGE